jgi:hypothetical protein
LWKFPFFLLAKPVTKSFRKKVSSNIFVH